MLLLLVAVPLAVGNDNTEVYRGFEFRETLHPDFITRLDPVPWEPEKKAHVKEVLDWLNEDYPGFIKHALQNGSVCLYRTPKRQLDYIDQPAYGGLRMVGFFDYDSSDSRVEETIVHELTHVADAFHKLANSEEWTELLAPRIDMITRWQEEENIEKSLTGWGRMEPHEITILKQSGLPSFYAASSPVEALAEVAASIIMDRKEGTSRYDAPDDLEKFIDSHLLSDAIEPYPAGEHYANGLILSRKYQKEEALAEFEKAVVEDPKFIRARLSVITTRHWISSTNSKIESDSFLPDLREVLDILPAYNRSTRLWIYSVAMEALRRAGDKDGVVELLETVNREYPPESRGPREYSAFIICADAHSYLGDPEKALTLYERAVELVPFKLYEMTSKIGGIRMALAETPEEKWAAHDKTILQMWQPLAEKGQPAAMLTLGKMYVWGTQAPKNYVEAIKWLTNAHNEGSSAADYWLAHIYNTGHGLVEADPELARQWARSSAESGDAQGTFLLGQLQLEDQDVVSSISIFKQAAEQKNSVAAYELGNIYASTRYGVQDLPESKTWYEKAAKMNHHESQFVLALIYLEEEQEMKEIMALLMPAAQKGHSRAQFKLGQLLAELEPSSPQSDQGAFQWLIAFAASSDIAEDDREKAESLIEELKTRIAPEQIEQLQKQIDAYLEQQKKTLR